MLKSIAKATAVASAVLLSSLASDVSFVGGIRLSEAEAVIGRPMTPLSYAGVARRTTRRMVYATSIYVATLPRGCTTVIIDGASLYQCGTTYYRSAGAQYVVVRVE
ncbi:hypothetical protein [Thiococcus pfennigii]|jgi:hypothetical protein|uniref:hypothetical protein n=1 Tax=Thiococcus pfennigii TaxID=1057 RepID=UPI001906D7E4|nr:hypothetical protein [Thiococcus pfennigii]MBK1700344.1 hypothetical protein [Thiococcus pfennigii]